MFTVQNALEQLQAWFYYTILDALNQFNQYMGNMGADLFDSEIIQGIVHFFQLLGDSLFGIGFVLALLEYAIDVQDGNGNIKDTTLNIGKAMFAVLLFTTIPVKLFQLSVDVQTSIANVIRGSAALVDPALSTPKSTGSLVTNVISFMTNLIANNPITNVSGAVGSFIANDAAATVSGQQHVPQITQLLFLIVFAYGFFKILFDNLKRGGILLIQISVCALYMFSIPRGYMDGFISWCKQVVGICLSTFMQNMLLVAGMTLFKDHMLIGAGLMLAGAEVPRISQAFGLDTSTKTNLSGAIHATSSIINLGKTFVH